jgi:CheY-like chemotaxis protein
MQIRCLIVDDNQPFLDAARLLLEREGVAVVGVATTSAEALRLEEELRRMSCWSTSVSVTRVASTSRNG